MNELQKEIVDKWLHKKSFKNFVNLYLECFELKWYQRPLWRLWRIVRNTWIGKQYYGIYKKGVDK